MSVLPPNADIFRHQVDVGFGPIADIRPVLTLAIQSMYIVVRSARTKSAREKGCYSSPANSPSKDVWIEFSVVQSSQ